MTWRAGVVTMVALAAPRAEANEGYFEFQLQSEILLDLVRERLVTIEASCPQPFDHDGDSTIIDHLEWQPPLFTLGEPRTENFPVNFESVDHELRDPIIEVPLDVHLKAVDCVTDPSCAVDDTEVVTAPLRFRVMGFPEQENGFGTPVLWPIGIQICAEYQGTDAELPAAAIDQIDALMDEIGGEFPGGYICADVPLGSMTGILASRIDGNDLIVSEVWPALSADLDRIGFRGRVDSYGWGVDDPIPWQPFFDGALAPNDGGDFSLFIEDRLITAAIAQPFWDGMTCPLDVNPEAPSCNDEIEPDGGGWFSPAEIEESLIASWSAGGLNIVVDADATHCSYYAVSLTVPFALSGNSLEIHATYGHPGSDFSGCMAQDPLAGEVWDTLHGIAAAAVASGNGASCSVGAPGHVDCSFPLVVPDLDFGPGGNAYLEPTAVNGYLEGLSIEGSIYLPPGFPADPLTFDASAPELDVIGTCHDLRIATRGYLTVGGGEGLYCDDPLTGEASPLLFDDPLGIFALEKIDSGPHDNLEIAFPKVDPDLFWDDPYPAQITVWSTVGSGSVDAGSPSHGGVDWELIAELVNAYVSCMRLETGLFGIPGRFDYHWIPDPPPYELVAVGGIWDGAAATVRQITVNQTARGFLDQRTGMYTIPASAATMTVTWSVTSGGTAFDFTSTVPMGADLVGMPLQQGYAVTLGAPMTRRFVVPANALPRGVTSASVEATFEAGAGMLTGIAVAR